MNTVYALTDGDILKIDKVLRKTWNEVYIWMLYKKTRSEYLENLEKIIRQNSK